MSAIRCRLNPAAVCISPGYCGSHPCPGIERRDDESRLSALTASNAKLREALEYFACGCNKFCYEMHKNKDDCGAYRARSALADAQGAAKEEI